MKVSKGLSSFQSMLLTLHCLFPDAINTEDLDTYNLISNDANENEIKSHEQTVQKFSNDMNKLRDHHVGIKDHYDRLERLVSSGPHSQDFIEPKVQGLWRVAQASNFTDKELASIKTELHHFESRLLKLRHLHAEHALHKEKYKVKDRQNQRRFEHLFKLHTYISFSRMKNIRIRAIGSKIWNIN